jgi:hypothetical protein
MRAVSLEDIAPAFVIVVLLAIVRTILVNAPKIMTLIAPFLNR